MSNLINPIGKEKNLATAITLSAIYVCLLNTGAQQVVELLDESSNVVSFFTMVANERLTIWKPITYSLSASSDIKALPVMRMQ